ncbi:MAG: 30S ribosomal protein S16 [Egibacteraceae bacterium]
MAVKMRLRREGKRKQPFYRVVVADVRSPRDGRFIEDIGYYQPLHDPSVVNIDRERALYWLRNGVQPSDAVVNLLRIQGIWEEFKPGDPGKDRSAKHAAEQAARDAKEAERKAAEARALAERQEAARKARAEADAETERSAAQKPDAEAETEQAAAPEPDAEPPRAAPPAAEQAAAQDPAAQPQPAADTGAGGEASGEVTEA